jgi:hypothetical protein
MVEHLVAGKIARLSAERPRLARDRRGRPWIS